MPQRDSKATVVNDEGVKSLGPTEDGKYVFYTAKDLETLRTDKIFRHKMGTSQEEDVLIYEEKDETFTTYVSKLKSKKYLVIHNSSSISDEYLLLNANSPLGDFKMFELFKMFEMCGI